MRVVQVKKIVVFISLLFFFYGNAQERIIRFDTKVQIQHSGIIQVTESIQIKAEGNLFNHGLLRVLPLNRKDKDGNEIDVGYEINSIKKDGIEEPYFTKEENDFYKIYIGSKDRELDAGAYTYQITYSMPYQIGYFEDYDELYWNVTGTDWEFSIDHATCEIYLPTENAKFKSLYSYSGAEGTKGSNAINRLINDKTVASFSIDGLRPYEGLTVAASFDKGVVLQPTRMEKAFSFYEKIKRNLWSVIYGLGMLLFFFFQWKIKAKDSVVKTIIPEFRPPFGWSPAIVGYLYSRKVNDGIYMASVVQMAIKGVIKITSSLEKPDNNGSKVYEIEILSAEPTNLSEEELALFKPIEKLKKIIVSQTNHIVFSKAYKGWLSVVSNKIKMEDYYGTNWLSIISGFLTLINVGLVALILSYTTGFMNYPVYIGLVISSLVMTYWVPKIAKDTVSENFFSSITSFMWLLVAVIYFASLICRSSLEIGAHTVVFIGYWIYCNNLENFTPKGVETLKRLEGFKLYLETAEKDRMNMLNPPELTPALFEELLPYAVALEVDVAWGNQFAKILKLAKYEPSWYKGNDDFEASRYYVITNISREIGDSRIDPTPVRGSSFSSSSSSSSSRGSSGQWSSGSKGGGSSGGGGGGGGGGGW